MQAAPVKPASQMQSPTAEHAPRPFDTLLQAPHFTPRAAVAVAAAS